MFTADQITAMQTALTTAVGKVTGVFVDLLPIMGAIAALGFGISIVRGLFNRVSNGG